MAKKNTDTVPSMLTPGEFVIKKESAKKIGYGKLNQMNKTGKVNTKKETKMPQGKGTYGSKVGRPPKKATGYKKGGEVKEGDRGAKKKKGPRGWLERVLPGGKSGYEKMSRKEYAQKIKSSAKYKKAQAKTKKDVQKKVLDPSWKKATTAAKKSGVKLTDLIKQRNAAKKGTDAYAKIQNQINKIYGSKKVHSRTSTGLKKLGETKKKLGKSKPSKEKMAEAYKLPKPPPKKKFEKEETWETIKKMQFGGRVPGKKRIQANRFERPPSRGPVRSYNEGGEVTSDGYPVHGASDKYKVGE